MTTCGNVTRRSIHQYRDYIWLIRSPILHLHETSIYTNYSVEPNKRRLIWQERRVCLIKLIEKELVCLAGCLCCTIYYSKNPQLWESIGAILHGQPAIISMIVSGIEKQHVDITRIKTYHGRNNRSDITRTTCHYLNDSKRDWETTRRYHPD